MSDRMDTSIRDHWSSRAEGYGNFVRRSYDAPKERLAWQNLYREVLGDRNGEILDCGCGPGTVSLRMSDMGYKMTAMDFSEDMLEEARKNADRYGFNIDFHQGDAEKNPFSDEQFDVVISQYMLWTVPHPEKVMSEWFRILKPGGLVFYIDGDWFNDPRNTRLRRFISRVAKALEYPKIDAVRKNGPSDRNVCNGLWSASAKRPDDDVVMMDKAGFKNIRVIHDINKRVMPGIRYYANGFTADYFMVVAEKE